MSMKTEDRRQESGDRSRKLERPLSHVATRDWRRTGFTLIELMASMAILGLIMVMLFSVFDQVNKAWLNGENRVETFTQARAILDLMSRELSQAIANNNMQFNGTANSVYFVAPVNSNPQNVSDLCGVGYDFEQYDGSSKWTLRINRHLIQPTTVAVANLLYNSPWWNNFNTLNDTVATLATNSVVALGFQYEDANGNWSTTWGTPTKLPYAITISLTNVDTRAAIRMRQFTPLNLPAAITKSAWRGFVTTVYLPNTTP